MTQVVTVHTDFTDLNQMTQGLIGRVNDSHVILPAAGPVDVGEWVQFAVTLHDGSPAFAGVGRCVTFVDNGEDRMPHQRFDVVFDSLEFDDEAREVYEHILSLSGSEEEGYEAGAEGDAEAAEADAPYEAPYEPEDAALDVSSDFSVAQAMPSAPAEEIDSVDDEFGNDDGDSTMVAGDAVLQAALARSTAKGEQEPDADDDWGTDEERATLPPQPKPEASNGVHVAAAYEPRAVNGASFAYPGGLPLPNKPPRPELHENQRVGRAPHPSK